MEAVKHKPECPSLSSSPSIAALGLGQLRTLLAGDPLTVLARDLGALRLAGLGLAPAGGQLHTAPAGEGLAGGLGYHQAGLLLDVPTCLGLYFSRHSRAPLALQTDLSLGGAAVLAGDGAADRPRPAGAFLTGHALTFSPLVEDRNVHTSLGRGCAALVLHRGLAHLGLHLAYPLRLCRTQSWS